ncbi:hypothetical protein Clacol_002743 [Clathrus columnatus]|uniref:Septation protein imp2 n=1 Tax=Clathrus columnatus TaxID=1419009 RepID=A0AAV5A6D2_9AGAM|nr:hypothetical protein Clacol_002743 [Clathrus columnatus]
MATARRTPSTTSLSKYVRDGPEADEGELDNRSHDFCNAFWGIAYGGYEVLLTRLRGAARTTEDLKAFWKERALLEDEYAKKLSKLAKQTLGRDEIGELRMAIDILRSETERQAQAHTTLATTIRKEMEQPIGELLNKHTYFKKSAQASIEKSFRAMQTQESYVKKARQKYEEDCIKINSFTAQATLVQGKELEKIQLKLEKTKQTVQSNERDYGQFSRALADTTARWEKEWKVFCDAAQDLEEERIEFMKDNMWGYANAISTSCEKIRVSLEQVEAEKDIENFVGDYSTGAQIPDPPTFVDFNSPNARQQQQPTWRLATFVRSSTRPVYPVQDSSTADDVPASPGRAGIGAVEGGIIAGSGKPDPTQSRPDSATAVRSPPAGITNSTNSGAVSPPPVTSVASGTVISSNQASKQPGMRITDSPLSINAGAPGITLAGAFRNTMRANTSDTTPASVSSVGAEPNTELKVGPNVYPVNPNDDPQRNRPPAGTGFVNANVGAQDDPLARQRDILRNTSVRKETSPNPATETKPSTMGKNVPPTSGPTSGSSPADVNPPTAAMMRPTTARSPSPLPVEKVVENYSPRLPGERRSRDMSRENGFNHNLDDGSVRREPSPAREIHPGIGAYGGSSRSPSPQPQPQPPIGYTSVRSPQQQAPPRNQTPLGIAIDESGRVAQDAFLERGRTQQNYAQPSNVPPPTSLNQNYNAYGQPVPPSAQYSQQPVGYNQPQQHSGRFDPRYHPQDYTSDNYGAPPNSGGYNVPPPPANPRVQRGYYPEEYGQQDYPEDGRGGMTDYDRTYYRPNEYGTPAVTARTPSPPAAPTNQYTEDGKPVLFYVKALYDYQATIDEEFDFQAGDIIAVTATPEDGWWSGELLDEKRRIPGKTVFPSNFVSLF